MLDSRAAELLAGCVGLGALVSLGRTSDGGALGVTITLDGRWRREYFREVEPLIEWLEQAHDFLTVAGPLAASSATRKRPRGRQRGL
jgi:hypothetical protein